MAGIWSFLGATKNRAILGWLGGGIVIVAAGLWAAFVYLFPPKGDGGEGRPVTAAHGGVATGGAVTNSTITTKPGSDESQPQGY